MEKIIMGVLGIFFIIGISYSTTAWIYMNIIIIAFVMLCLLGSACRKYAKYADKLIPSIMIFNIAILIFCNYLYDNGLNQIICISSLTILVISLYKNGLRFQNGRLVNPNIIITSGFIPLFFIWYLLSNSISNWENRVAMILILFIPLFFNLKYYLDIRSIILLGAIMLNFVYTQSNYMDYLPSSFSI